MKFPILKKAIQYIPVFLIAGLCMTACGQTKPESGKPDMMDAELLLDKDLISWNEDEESYTSFYLDSLLNASNNKYYEWDKSLTPKGIMNIGIVNPGNTIPTWLDDIKCLLIYKENEQGKQILTDTFTIQPNQDYALQVTFGDDSQGVAIGVFDMNKYYFRIHEKYRITENGKLQKLKRSFPVKECSVPSGHRSPARLFTYGTK